MTSRMALREMKGLDQAPTLRGLGATLRRASFAMGLWIMLCGVSFAEPPDCSADVSGINFGTDNLQSPDREAVLDVIRRWAWAFDDLTGPQLGLKTGLELADIKAQEFVDLFARDGTYTVCLEERKSPILFGGVNADAQLEVQSLRGQMLILFNLLETMDLRTRHLQSNTRLHVKDYSAKGDPIAVEEITTVINFVRAGPLSSSVLDYQGYHIGTLFKGVDGWKFKQLTLKRDGVDPNGSKFDQFAR